MTSKQTCDYKFNCFCIIDCLFMSITLVRLKEKIPQKMNIVYMCIS